MWSRRTTPRSSPAPPSSEPGGIGRPRRRDPEPARAAGAALFERRLQEIVAIGREALADPDPWQGLITFIERAAGLQANDRGLREVLFGTRFGRRSLTRIRDNLRPIAIELVARAQAGGRLRADLSATDVPPLMLMVSTVADYAREARPDVFRRHITMLIDGLAARRADTTPLPVAALTDDQLEQAMRSWHP
jgi:hypothetical protein